MKFILPLLMLLSSPPPAVGDPGTGLEEDKAELSGDFEDGFAFGSGVNRVVELDELVDDDAAASGEIGEAGARRFGRGARTGGASEDLIDGLDELGRVLGNEAEGFAINQEAAFLHGWLNGGVLAGGYAGEFGELEEGGSEAIEESDESICMAAAATEVGGAEGAPGGSDGTEEFFVADAAEDLCVGGGAASANGDEGAALTEDAPEVDEFRGIGGELRVGHVCPGLVRR